MKVQVIRNSSLQRALEEAGCPPPDTQAIQPSSEFYTINGKKDGIYLFLIIKAFPSRFIIFTFLMCV